MSHQAFISDISEIKNDARYLSNRGEEMSEKDIWLAGCLLFVALIFLAWQCLAWLDEESPGDRIAAARRRRCDAGPVVHYWRPSGRFDVSVVMDPQHAAVVRSLLHKEFDPSLVVRPQLVALLVPKDADEWGDRMIAVLIDERYVGRLPRKEARTFYRRLRAKNLMGMTTGCTASIEYSNPTTGSEANLSIRLDISDE